MFKNMHENFFNSVMLNFFLNNPIPMWIFDTETLAFLNVNNAATEVYGYSMEEFLSMTIRDIRPKEDVPLVEKDVINNRQIFEKGSVWKHLKKDGTPVWVMVTAFSIIYNNREARLITALDITKNKIQEAELSRHSERLKDIAWKQSHLVRAPLSNIQALVKILKNNSAEQDIVLSMLEQESLRLDKIITEIIRHANN